MLRPRVGGLRREADGGEREGHGYDQGAEERTKSCCLHMRFLSEWVQFFSGWCLGRVPGRPREAEEPWGGLFARDPSSPTFPRYARSVHCRALLSAGCPALGSFLSLVFTVCSRCKDGKFMAFWLRVTMTVLLLCVGACSFLAPFQA
jgi:hypothetical protein